MRRSVSTAIHQGCCRIQKETINGDCLLAIPTTLRQDPSLPEPPPSQGCLEEEPGPAGHQGLLSTSTLQAPTFPWGSTLTCLVTPLSRICLARHSRDRGTFSSWQKWSSSSASHRVDRRLPITRSTERRWKAPSSIPSSTWTQRSQKSL